MLFLDGIANLSLLTMTADYVKANRGPVKVKVKVSPMYDSVRWGVPVRGTLILSRRHSEVGWPVPFLAAFNFPSFATRYPFAAG